MSLLGDLLDARRRVVELEERYNPSQLRDPGGEGGGQWVKMGASGVALKAVRRAGRTAIPEGSGAKRPRSSVARARTSLPGLAPGAGAERAARKANKRKLTEKELPGAVGRGPWSRAVAKTVKDLTDGTVADTEQAHRSKLPNGKMGPYSPERIALHAQIARALFQGAGSHPEGGRAVFLAGGPASGKSSLVKSGQVKLPGDYVDVNPDIVRTMLPEYQRLLDAGDKQASVKTHEEASHISKMVMNLALLRRNHVVVDGVGNSGPDKFAGKIRATTAAGYDAMVVYATIPTDEAIRRSELRAKRSGRVVPVGYLRSAHRDVTRRYVGDIEKMPGITVKVFDNSGKGPTLIAERLGGGVVRIVKRKLYREFIAKAGEGES